MKKYFRELITHPLFSGGAVMVVGLNSVSFINYLYHLVIGRMLGPSGYGELASLISLIGLLGIIPSSVSLVIIKYVSAAKNDQQVNNLVSWLKNRIVKISISFFIIILLASPVISSFLKINKIAYSFLIGLSFLFSLQSALNRSILQGLMRFKEMVVSILIENTSKLLISIILIFVGFYVSGAMIALAIAAFVGLYITNSYLRFDNKKNNPNTSPNIKSMLLFTIPVLIQSLSTTSIYSSDVILVKHFFSSHDAGIYAALSTLGKIIFFGTGPIGAVMFPLVSQRYAKGYEYRRIFIYSFLITIIFSMVMILVYGLVPNFVISLLYGDAYLKTSSLLVWFGIFISLFSLSSLLINYSLSLGDTKVVLYPAVAALVQITAIWFYHQSIHQVVTISILIMALLLASLLIYLIHRKRIHLWR